MLVKPCMVYLKTQYYTISAFILDQKKKSIVAIRYLYAYLHHSVQMVIAIPSIVEEVLNWLEVPLIVLRSTVYVGFTDEMMEKSGKEIVFQPEYYGETVAHPFADLNNRTWLSFGGTKRGIDLAIKTYQTVINSNVRIYQADAKSVEMAKYMENAFLATKVTFCNEMYDIAMALGADYNLAREIWIADPRIGASHTFVYEDNRGYGGSCLPKDIASITTQGNKHGVDTTLLQSVIEKNSIYKKNEE